MPVASHACALETKQGDLLALAAAGEFDVIVHGANCFCTMGAGIAKRIRKEFPEAFAADRLTPRGDRAKLGTISVARVLPRHAGAHAFAIVNAYTQYDWRGPRGSLKADYDAIRAAMLEVKARFHGQRIGYPLIGAGLAGGSWPRIAAIVADTLAGEDHTLVVLPPQPDVRERRRSGTRRIIRLRILRSRPPCVSHSDSNAIPVGRC